jgi:hypothetical protein
VLVPFAYRFRAAALEGKFCRLGLAEGDMQPGTISQVRNTVGRGEGCSTKVQSDGGCKGQPEAV